MGATRGRESMPSYVQGLVKLAPLIMHLNEFSLKQCSFSCCEVMNSVAFHENGFDMRSSYLLGEGLQHQKFMSSIGRVFSMSVWYLLRSVEMVKDIDVLWDIVFVICIIYESMRDMEVKDSKNMGL